MPKGPTPLRLRVPSSKSLTQRGLVLAALAQGESTILDPLDCDDTRHLRRALGSLGVRLVEEQDRWHVHGGALTAARGPLECGNGGTTCRFLAALSLLVEGQMVLEGDHNLHQRPIHDVSLALGQLGVQVRYLGEEGFPPLALKRSGPAAQEVQLDASRTSQFLSGLLMVGPCLTGGLSIEPTGRQVSRPYVDLSIRAMQGFGVEPRLSYGWYHVAPAAYRPSSFQVEGDWSAGAALLAAAQITGREVDLENLSHRSLQGDRVIVDFLEELKQHRPHRFDLAPCPDLIGPLAVAAAFADQPTEIVHVAHARFKECDRIAVLAQELGRCGVAVRERPDGLVLSPAGRLKPVRLHSHDDHRMAMAFGLLSLREPGIQVDNPSCTTKSFPDFWEVLESFRPDLRTAR